MSTKFKSDPYNVNNRLITSTDVIDILSQVNINDIQITNLSLFQRAFNHKSYCIMKDYEEYTKPPECIELQEINYETLEFLGDAFLDVIVAEYLYKRYSDQNEGFLTKIKTRLVNGEQLSYYTNCLKMNHLVLLSKHVEENCEGRKNIHILEDIFEAFIGALYHDSGDFKLVERYLINIIEKYVDFGETILHDNNYKDQVLRYLQHNYKVYPNYNTYKEGSIYICKIYKEDEHIETGRGNSKKKSEQDAAKRALIKYCVISE